jgi:hypothetical protein
VLTVDPGIVLQDYWERCRAEDRAGELVRKAERLSDRAYRPKQYEFVVDTSKRIVACCGSRAGKTTGAIDRLAATLLTVTGAQCLYIATNRDQCRKLLWEPLKALLKSLDVAARFYEDRLQCVMSHNSATVTLDGANDAKEIEKYRGIPYDLVIIDESASYKPALLDNLVDQVITPRLADREGTLILIGTPGRTHLGKFYELTRTGSDAGGWSRHRWNAKDNADSGRPLAVRIWNAFLKEKADNGWSDENPIWLREVMGVWARDSTSNVYAYRPHDEDGKEFNRWNPKRNAFGFAELPADLKDVCYVYGCDFGIKDPFCVQVFAYSLSDPRKTLYHVYEFSQRGLNTRQIAERLIGPALDIEHPAGIYGQTGYPDAIGGDSSTATILKDLAEVYGIRIEPAPRGYQDKLAAIEVFNGDLVDGRIKILEGSKLEEQLSQLQWAVKENGSLQEDPGAENDACDGAIYARGVAKHLLAQGVAPEAAPDITKPSLSRGDTPAAIAADLAVEQPWSESDWDTGQNDNWSLYD